MTIVRTPLFPLYSEVRKLLMILDGVPRGLVREMISVIREQTGTPQNPVDWSDPDTWITTRLSGEAEYLARHIWELSDKTINPRHIYGSYLFINGFELLVPDDHDIYRLLDRGKAFIEDNETIVREIDEAEGLPQLLGMLATKTRARRGDLVPEWGEFLREHSNYGTDSTIKDTLRRRLLNLIERGYVSREGNAYSITQKGLDYAAPVDQMTDSQPSERHEVTRAISQYNEQQIENLAQLLGKMHPYKFEQLVRDLLEAMGYEDVTVTKESGDRGVDVVAKVQFGITTITEVVQAKRYQGTVGRPVIDQLRGALPYQDAIRGTIITTGTFSRESKEFALYQGAAPISLIDGTRLVELLVEHQIGIRQRPAMLYEVDTEVFAESDEQREIEEALIERA